MLIALAFALQVMAPATNQVAGVKVEPVPVYSGIAGETTVRVPRLVGRPVVDGRLDDPQWTRAAQLRGFSQYNPVDGQPAADSTTALVWFADDAIYFGVRAYAPPGAVRGTLADRDKIDNDDNVQVILDTFNDNRRAFVFAVNPLGVQADGVRSEGGGPGGAGGRGPGGAGRGGGSSGGGGFSRLGLSNADLSQDMTWESRGRVTDVGYEVEIRIPFNAVRYNPAGNVWGLNIVRTSQYRAVQDSWAPARRGTSSILVQSGRLTGLSDLKRGLVLDITPVVTSLTSGAIDTIPGSGTEGYAYRTGRTLGGDVRWGVTSNLTLNATVRPDFSQVEADAGQIPGDVRFAVSFPELRPFFVEGGENFDAPNRLVYTRRIVQPVGAAKLIGKIGSSDVAVLSAVDGAEYGASGRDNPIYNLARIRHDLGAQSTIGGLVTDREEGARFNRVAATDGRFVFRDVYAAAFQVGASTTDSGTGPRFGRLWETSIDRSGRSYGFRNSIKGLSNDFHTDAGFVNRTDNVEVDVNQRYTHYGAPGASLQQVMWFFSGRTLWSYDGFFGGAAALESRGSLSINTTLRGGWSFNLSPSVNSDRFDPADYARYFVAHGADTLAFIPGAPVRTAQVQVRMTTPQFAKWAANASMTYGSDADFLETTRAHRTELSLSLDLRPTPQVRVTTTMLYQQFVRDRDASTILETTIPRLRLEYQASRAIQFRFVGQYESRTRDALSDPATGNPIVFRNVNGTFTAASRSESNRLRVDWLIGFLPTPGRVIYIGYGATLTQDDAFSFRDIPRRTNDGLFVKASYQFRLR